LELAFVLLFLFCGVTDRWLGGIRVEGKRKRASSAILSAVGERKRKERNHKCKKREFSSCLPGLKQGESFQTVRFNFPVEIGFLI
jgi:hypothetical protein